MAAERTVSQIDTVTLTVINNALVNLCREMGTAMMRTSYSTIFNEGLDFSTVLLDREGNLVAEKNYTPSMMGAITHTVRWTLELQRSCKAAPCSSIQTIPMQLRLQSAPP